MKRFPFFNASSLNLNYTGFNSPRSNGKDGSPLPSPRKISNTLFRAPGNCSGTDYTRSLMVMAWGQFIDHDIVATPATQGIGRYRSVHC